MLTRNQKHELHPQVVKEYWTPPMCGWAKWNTDSSRNEGWESTTIAIVCKDD